MTVDRLRYSTGYRHKSSVHGHADGDGIEGRNDGVIGRMYSSAREREDSGQEVDGFKILYWRSASRGWRTKLHMVSRKQAHQQRRYQLHSAIERSNTCFSSLYLGVYNWRYMQKEHNSRVSGHSGGVMDNCSMICNYYNTQRYAHVFCGRICFSYSTFCQFQTL